MKLPRLNIALRTALLSWTVTLATLLVFVMVILPWQEQTFLRNLDSKAHGVSISLQGVAAGAAVNEDYSSVVDHAREMITGDPTIAYLIITKNDGFSLIHDRSGWHSETNAAPEWRPAVRQAFSRIHFNPHLKVRAFTHSQPFDYSGIEWGWIHVGLSLDSYDQSVAQLYQLAIGLGLACAILSLVASILYARRLVQPVLNLRETVQRVAHGDLSARASEDRTDELGQLAASVNAMTAALLRRDEILGSVQFAAQRFLGTTTWESVIDQVLEQIGRSADVSRAYMFAMRQAPDQTLLADYRAEWVAEGIKPELTNPELTGAPFLELGFVRWAETFHRHEMIAGIVQEFPVCEHPLLLSQQIKSIIVAPVMVNDVWWGFIGLDDCRQERLWSAAERDSLQALADIIGAAIARQEAQQALLEAKATLEQRVLERTAALRREIVERREAEHALSRSLSVINATLESTLDGIMVLGRDGKVKHFNRRFTDMWRITPEFLTTANENRLLTYVSAQLKDPRGFLREALRLHADPSRESFDIVEFKDGRIYERFTRPQFADGVSAGRVWSYRDVTERKRAEAEIAYERDLLQTLLDSLPDTLYFKDADSRFVRISRSKAVRALPSLRARYRALHPDEASCPFPAHLESPDALRSWLVGKTDFDVLSAEEAAQRRDEELAILRTGEPLNGKIEFTQSEFGERTWLLVIKMPWRDEEGNIVGTYGVSKDITELKEAEEKVNAIHQELLLTSRQAGMAEVATGVLHNVGNVLNSINVSATLVRDKLHASEIKSLVRVADLLKAQEGSLAEFLLQHPKGQLVPKFIIQLGEHLANEHSVLLHEHEQLARNVEHIKEIVSMQQNYARVSGVLETVNLSELLNDALQINSAGLVRHRIDVERDFADLPPLVADRHRVMQILVNLVHNAKYALDDSAQSHRRLTLRIRHAGENRVEVIVADNGIGISQENLTRIFSHGFTTRKTGHGFGLHSGAIAAREMGGSLQAFSDGVGCGATFVLELPINPQPERA